MGNFITEDGRRMPFIDWANVNVIRTGNNELLLTELRVFEESQVSCPQLIAANELLDRNLIAFIQGE